MTVYEFMDGTVNEGRDGTVYEVREGTGYWYNLFNIYTIICYISLNNVTIENKV